MSVWERVCMCGYVYITYVCVVTGCRVHGLVHEGVYVFMFVDVGELISVYVVYMSMHMYVRMLVYTCVLCVYVYMYVCNNG